MISLSVDSLRKISWSEFKFRWDIGAQFKIDAQIEFIKQINSFTDNNLSILKAIELTKESYQNIYGSKSFYCTLCDRLTQSVESGEGQRGVLNKYFHPNIAIAYEVMRFSQKKNVVTEVSELIVLERDLIKNAFTTMASPAMLFFGGIGSLTFIGATVVPKMIERADKIKDTDELPIEMDLALGFASFFSSYGLFIAAFFLLLIGALKFLLPNLVPSTPTKALIRHKIDNLWPCSLYKSLWSVRLIKLYGLLKQSNIRDTEILKLLKLFVPPFCRFYLNKMEQGFLEGKPKRDYFLKGIISKNQEVRLSPYFSHSSNEDFANNLIVVSTQATQDVSMQFRRATKKYSLFLYMTGAVLMVLSIGAVFESANFIY
tara:strand:+ start:422 stop:1540 length:1119 start_codon:yes stop_codon:yes gene_type:complete